MDLVRATLLGILQGITEFLPISSDGHLLLVRRLFQWPDEGLLFDAALHSGTFLAVLVFFRSRWWRLAHALFGRGSQEDRALLRLILLATLPGALVGYLGKAFIGGAFRGLSVTGAGFLSTAVLLGMAEYAGSRRRAGEPERFVTARQAFMIGIMQILALFPGLSRSGSTIAGGLLFGLSRERAVEFSFLLSLPIVGGAGVYGFLQEAGNSHSPIWPLVLGILFAFLSGIGSIAFFLRYVRTHSLRPFLCYLVAVSLLSFLLSR